MWANNAVQGAKMQIVAIHLLYTPWKNPGSFKALVG